jgi:hypothetical protein
MFGIHLPFDCKDYVTAAGENKLLGSLLRDWAGPAVLFSVRRSQFLYTADMETKQKTMSRKEKKAVEKRLNAHSEG